MTDFIFGAWLCRPALPTESVNGQGWYHAPSDRLVVPVNQSGIEEWLELPVPDRIAALHIAREQLSDTIAKLESAVAVKH